MPSSPTKKSSTSTSGNSETVKVVVRIRPLSSREVSDGRKIITTADESRGVIELLSGGSDQGGKGSGSSSDGKHFTFDSVLSDKFTQKDVYDKTAASAVNSVLEGYNATIFCYGQVSSVGMLFIS